jgi:hypothetical protein
MRPYGASFSSRPFRLNLKEKAMAKVICKLPNASNLIGGIKFTDHPDNPKWKVSDDIPEDHAATLATINGYELVGAKKGTSPSEEDAELADLRARAIALKLPNASQMGLDKLRERVPAAEEAAAKDAAAKGGTTQQPLGDSGGAGAGSGQ